jgi:hypothetical protein
MKFSDLLSSIMVFLEYEIYFGIFRVITYEVAIEDECETSI